MQSQDILPAAISALLLCLIEKIRQICTNAEKIILIGSAADKNLFRPGDSDVGLIVLGKPGLPISFETYQALTELAEDHSGAWRKIDIT
jgi:predicted nucleotidyltransferase